MPDPSVSPADTIRRIEELREKAARRGRIDHEEGARFATADWDDVLFLLAVGERDRQHIARLTEALEAFFAEFDGDVGMYAPTDETEAKMRAAVLAGEEDTANG